MIKVTLEASKADAVYHYDYDDLGVTEQEWEDMTDNERQALAQSVVNDDDNQPYWVVAEIDE